MTRRNLCPEPVPVAPTGWVSNRVLTVETIAGFDRPTATRITGTGTGGEHYIVATPGAATPGSAYTASVGYRTGTATQVTAYLLWLDAASAVIAATAHPDNPITTTGGEPTRVHLTGTAPPGAAAGTMQISLVSASTAVLHATMGLLEADDVPGTYFDGDSPGGTWDGTPGASTSTLTPVPTTTTPAGPRQDIPPAHPTRVLAQSILTGQWLSWELPLADVEITHTLSGPDGITGTFDPDRGDEHDLDLEPWATWIHVEDSGQIRASGILQPIARDVAELAIEAVGVSAYPAGIPFTDHYEAIQVDPWTVFGVIWDHLQAQPEGDLGVIVDPGATPVRLGTEKQDVSFETSGGEPVDFTAGPYSLAWWDRVDCGRELSELASEAPFDWLERSHWNADKTGVEHHLVLGYPRHGRRRDDLGFREGENLIAAVALAEPADRYASQVLVTGAGEGRDMIRGYAGRRLGLRVRRAVVIEDKEITSTSRANARAAEELARRQASLLEVAEVEVDARHDNAPLGSFQCGDDIAVQARFTGMEERTVWSRIESYTYNPASERCRLRLAASDSYRYGG